MAILDGLTLTERRLVIIGALCWILGLELFAAELIASAAWPGYSASDMDISFLGATRCGPFTDRRTGEVFQLCSPRHAVMNAGLVLYGALHLAGATLTWPAWPRRWQTTVGLPALAAGSVGAALAGLAPVDVDMRLHSAAAGLALMVGNLGIVLLGLSAGRRAPAFCAFSLAAGLLAIAGFLLFGSHVFLGLGRGGMERVSAYPQIVWYAVAGTALLVEATRGPRPRRSRG